MGEILIRIGTWWWRPSRGVQEAISYHPRWSDVVWLLVMDVLAMGLVSLLSIGGSFRSLGGSIGGVILFSLSFLVWWVVVFALMMMLLVSGFRRVVVPERLVFLLVVSHLPWVFLFPVGLAGLWIGRGFIQLVSFVAGFFSLWWLLEVFRREYALSFSRALVLVVVPGVLLVLQLGFWFTRVLITLVLMGRV